MHVKLLDTKRTTIAPLHEAFDNLPMLHNESSDRVRRTSGYRRARCITLSPSSEHQGRRFAGSELVGWSSAGLAVRHSSKDSD